MYNRTVDIPDNSLGAFTISRKNEEVILSKEPIGIIMQDSEKEYDEHSEFLEMAKGKILVGGLGIGFINNYLMHPKITEVTIIENSPEVIKLVWPHCTKDQRFRLIYGDVEDFLVGRYFDTVPQWDYAWFDTWLTDNPLTQEEYKTKIQKKFRHYCRNIYFWENNKSYANTEGNA